MTSLTDRQAWDRLILWIVGITGVPHGRVIKSHPGEDRPVKPYIVVNFLSRSHIAADPNEIEFFETDVLNSAGEKEVRATPVMAAEWHFSIHAYDDDPTDVLRPIRSAIELQQKQEPLRPLMIFDVSRRDNRVPDFINGAWEERAQMDIYVRGWTRDGFIVDVIETFEDDDPTEITRL